MVGKRSAESFKRKPMVKPRGGRHLWSIWLPGQWEIVIAYELDHDLLCFLDDDVRIFSTLVSVQWVPPPPFLSFSSDPVM